MSTTRQTFVAGIALTALVGTQANAATAGAGGARLVVLYTTPKDSAAFDSYYLSTHAPLAKKLPGLRSYVVSKGDVTTPGATAQPYHFFAELQFDSVDAIKAALASPQGAVVVADLPNFASAGVTITMMEIKDIG
jgi:uncharacterized protein (TIGR02118 family)